MVSCRSAAQRRLLLLRQREREARAHHILSHAVIALAGELRELPLRYGAHEARADDVGTHALGIDAHFAHASRLLDREIEDQLVAPLGIGFELLLVALPHVNDVL